MTKLQNPHLRLAKRLVSVAASLLAAGPLMAAQPPGFDATNPPTAVGGQIKVLFAKVGQDDKGNSVVTGGGTMDVQIRVAPNATNNAIVSCSIPNPVAHNDSWQASAWMAAFVSARAKDKVLSDFEFSVIAPDAIDGPSAGMALTAGMLSLMNGQPILKDRAMTGTINPDGTVGPVGGILHKLRGAKEAGVTKFGYPVGQRLMPDMPGGRSPTAEEEASGQVSFKDVVDEANRLDMEAVEIRDLADAYLLLTGQSSHLEVPDAPVVPPAISLPAFNKLRAAVISLRELFKEEHERALKDVNSELGSLNGTIAREKAAQIRGDLKDAKIYEQRASNAISTGSVVAGYFHMIRALAICESASNKQKTFNAVLQPIPKSTTSEQRTYEYVYRTVTALTAIRKGSDRSLEELRLAVTDNLHATHLVPKMEALSAFISLREASAHHEAASRMLRAAWHQLAEAFSASAKSATTSEVEGLLRSYINSVDRACQYYAMSRTRCRTAKDWYTLAAGRDPEHDVAVKLGLEFFQTLGRAYSKGAQATLAYLDVTTRDMWTQSIVDQSLAAGFSNDVSRYPEMISLVEPRYLPISISSNVEVNRAAAPEASNRTFKDGKITELIQKQWEMRGEKEDNLDAFGSGASAFLGLSTLVLKYYNYQGNDEKMVNSRSMGVFIDMARSKALNKAETLKKAMLDKLLPDKRKTAKNVLPEALCLNLELADSLRFGDEYDKVTCLQTYWRAHLLADLGLAVLQSKE